MLSCRQYICIDTERLNKQFIYMDQTGLKWWGYCLLRHFYFTEHDDIKWNTIKKWYPSLQQVLILNVEPIQMRLNRCRQAPSIRIDDRVMRGIQSFLASYSNKQVSCVRILYPQNDLDELREIKKKYEASFESIGYIVRINENYERGDFVEGSCPLFDVVWAIATDPVLALAQYVIWGDNI
mmetsp:Transcript_42056/g.67611  ORF Transcript_42056/g.67611 Transcript_42056/m.67611 type:complete len:181 (-) Transcript_42056:2-544(-)